MKHTTRAAILMLAGLVGSTGLPARGAGGPGGHGGSGGHGASGGHGFGGHGGRGGFSGRSSGHPSGSTAGRAIGHSLGRFFGRHGKAPSRAGEAAPLAGTAVVHGKVVQLAGPRPVPLSERSRFHRRHVNGFPFGDRFFLFPQRFGFGFDGFDGCGPFAFPRHRFFLQNGFDCFGAGFFFDPFFLSGFPGFFVGGEEFEPPADAPDNFSGSAEANIDEQSSSREPNESESGALETNADEAVSKDQEKNAQVVTLLQLRDGSMYGLTRYWVEGSQLHYVTTYGGQDSIALDRIDLEMTMKLNSERGVEFALRPKTTPQ